MLTILLFLSPNIVQKWDTAAPTALLKAVGGNLTDITGAEYSYDKNVRHNNATGILATRNPEVHKWIIDNIPTEVKISLTSQL